MRSCVDFTEKDKGVEDRERDGLREHWHRDTAEEAEPRAGTSSRKTIIWILKISFGGCETHGRFPWQVGVWVSAGRSFPFFKTERPRDGGAFPGGSFLERNAGKV